METGAAECSKAFNDAAKVYEKVKKKYGKKDLQYQLRATVAAGVAYKRADKVKNRKKTTKLLKAAAKIWAKLQPPEPKEGAKPKKKRKAKKPAEPIAIEDSTKVYAALGALELAEYSYDDYAKLRIEAINKRGEFDMKKLGKTLEKKAKALGATSKDFDVVLGFRDPGMAAAAAFREGQLLYEFAESLFNAPVPPEIAENPDDVDEYRYQLEEFAAPIQEKSLKAFTLALKSALDKNVYNSWSRRSAEFAAKVNPDEFPLSDFNVQPDKMKDTLQSTSFVSIIRRGDVVVNFND